MRGWGLIENTLLLAAATCAISVPVGIALGWLVSRTDLPGRRFWLAVFVAMLFVPLYLQAAAWQAGFGLQGWQTLRFGPPPLLDGWRGAIWVHTMAALPWAVLICAAGFRLVEPELEERALLDGSSWQIFWGVSLPAAFGAVLVAEIWIAVMVAGEMTVTDLFMIRTYAEEVYTRMAVGPQPGEAPLAALPGVILCAGLALAGLWVALKAAPGDRPVSFQAQHRFALGHWRLPALLAVALVVLLVAGVPIANLCYKAGVTVSQADAGRVRSWSLAKCAEIVAASPFRYQREFGWSLAIGGLAATASVAGAVMLTWWARTGRFRTAVLLVLMAVLLTVPGPVVGLGVIHMLNRPEVPLLTRLYDHSILAPWLALVLRSLAPASLVLWHAFRFVPSELLDAAAVDGAGPLTTLWRIVLPTKIPALAIAWLVAMAVAVGDLAASILVVPPGVTTLSIEIFGLLHYGVEDQVAGISLVMIALSVLLSAGAILVARRWQP